MIEQLGKDHPQILEYQRMITNGTIVSPELREAMDGYTCNACAETPGGCAGYIAHAPPPVYADDPTGARYALREIAAHQFEDPTDDRELRVAALKYARAVLAAVRNNADVGTGYDDALEQLEDIARDVKENG